METHIPAKSSATLSNTFSDTAAALHAHFASEIASLPENVQSTLKLIIQVLDDNKAEDIVPISLAGKSSFADAMIVASGRSPRHVAALTDHVEKALKTNGVEILSTEGKQVGDWVLVDAGDIIIHLFRPEVRAFYNLEKMWSIPAAPDM